MRPSLRLLTLTLALAVSCTAAHAQDAADARAEIRALIEQTEAANNAGDVEGWVALFAEDAVYLGAGAPAVTTREGLVDVAKAGFRNRAAIDIVPVEIEVAGDWAFARSEVGGTVEVHDTGEVVPVDVKQIAIYRRGADGTWRIARLISNGNR